MDRAARLLRGTLRVRVESAFPERVLNLCGAHGIAFPTSDGRARARCPSPSAPPSRKSSNGSSRRSTPR